MNKLFPNSLEFVKKLFEINNVTNRYKIKTNYITGVFESLHLEYTSRSFINFMYEDFETMTNDYLTNKYIDTQKREYLNNLLSKENKWEEYIGIPIYSNYDFIAILRIFKTLLKGEEYEIENIDKYIDNILINIYTDFFKVDFRFNDDEETYREVEFFPENFSYKNIENDIFMTRYFFELEKVYNYGLVEHFDKYPFLLLNKRFLELALSKKEITNYLKINEEYKKKLINYLLNESNNIIEILHKNGELLEYLPVEMKKKFEIVYAAINNEASAYEFADQILKNDSRIINLMLQKGKLSMLSDEIKNNKELAQISILSHPSTFADAGSIVRRDQELLIFYLKSNSNLDNIPEEFFEDIEFMTRVIFLKPRKYNWFLKNVPSVFKNYEVCREVLINDGSALKILPEDKKNNPQLVSIAIKDNINNLQYAGMDIRSNKLFMFEIVNKDNRAYCYFTEEMKLDYELALKIINRYPEAYSHLPNRFKNDPKIIDALFESIFLSQIRESEKWPQLKDNNNDNDIYDDVIAAIFGDD